MLTPKERAYVERWHPFSRRIASDMWVELALAEQPMEWDDWVGVAQLALVRAVADMDWEAYPKGCSRFLYKSIRGRLLEASHNQGWRRWSEKRDDRELCSLDATALDLDLSREDGTLEQLIEADDSKAI